MKGCCSPTAGNAAACGPGAPGSGYNAVKRWDDLSSPILLTALDITTGRLGYDYFNGGVVFNTSARYPGDPVIIPLQRPHASMLGEGAVLRPHIHWLQQQSDTPNFLLGYKKINQGSVTTFETDYSNYTFLTPVANKFTYTSGTILQITEFSEIDISDLEISAQMNFVMFRDYTNVSGLFTGSDPVASGITVTYQDQHNQIDADGSREEYTK